MLLYYPPFSLHVPNVDDVIQINISKAAILEFKMAGTYYIVGFGIIGFLAPENMGIAVKIKSISLVRAEI